MSRKHVWSFEDDVVSIDLEDLGKPSYDRPPGHSLVIRVDEIDVWDLQDTPALLIEVAKSIMSSIVKWNNDQIEKR